MRFPGMSLRHRESHESEVSSSHVQEINTASPPALVTPLSHAQLPTWTFPSSSSAPESALQSPSSPIPTAEALTTDAVFPLQPAIHPQSEPTPEEDLASPRQPSPTRNSTQPSLFNTPSRSIFSSGPPTASVSANTAHASMSSPSPARANRPLSVLNGPSVGSSSSSSRGSKQAVLHAAENTRAARLARMSRAEKDIDDISVTLEQTALEDRWGISTPTALTRLFAAPEPTPIVSRHSSYIRTVSGTAYTRASTETAPLPNHLYSRGLLGGRHSDIIVNAFGTRYPLHRLILDRAPFFSSALSEPWFESTSKEITLHPEDIDTNIGQAAFELALKRLYGSNVANEEDAEAIGLFATGCWLEMPDLIDASVSSILRQMTTAKLGSLIGLVTSNYYGKPGDRILASAKAMLCREGWEMPLKCWDAVPGEIAREIVGGDGFFVPGEWERFIVAKRIFDRKLKLKAIEAGLMEANGKCKGNPPDTMSFSAVRFDTVYRRNSSYVSRQLPEIYDTWLALYTSPDIAAMLVLLDEGIHYVHLSFEQLQQIRKQRDVLGLPLMPDKVIDDAFWMQMVLRQRIVNTPKTDLELGLSCISEDAEENEAADRLILGSATGGKGKQRDSKDSELLEEENDIDSGSWDGNAKPRKFWIPIMDSTSVMGGHPDTAPYAPSSTNRPQISRLSATIDPADVQWASDFTGVISERPTISERNDALPPFTYTYYPPFRFAAEFPNPRNLKEKERVYSRTVWYAGSMWNVYIQKRKNAHLGVYLHRAKEKEGQDDHHSGVVDERIGQVEQLMRRNFERDHHHRRHHRSSRGETVDEDSSTDPDATLVGSSAVDHNASRTAAINSLLRSGPGNVNETSKSVQSPTNPSLLPMQILDADSDNDIDSDSVLTYTESTTTVNSVPTIPTYTDSRPEVKTYFKIYSPSRGGRMLSVYESAPDVFNFIHSWGWKSSTMVLDDAAYGYDSSSVGANGVGTDPEGGNSKVPKDGRLRFMVVIGNV